MNKEPMTLGSLFDGSGGFPLGRSALWNHSDICFRGGTIFDSCNK